MLRWPRRNTLPADLRDRLRLRRGERVIAHAPAPGHGAVVATTASLRLPDGRAVPWERVERARWDDQGLVLTVEGEAELAVAVPEPGPLAEAVFERVTATIVVSTHVPLLSAEEGAPGVRLVARRAPGGTEVVWGTRYDEGVDPGSPEIRERAARALAALREQTGV
ncbi:hypothetical protein [Actinorugispora endophytica]|uniref:Uncharacterized protein n=1 Tax=Actinorugispora endophytica TaxID=1605990 RepID=A0A4R6V5W3_9ACTN|nr:hypothetical protein [Actinorugispora endophytica]TDQ51584.1 hypothetical protein EV190_11073 [Actinorugispora endophytica]